MFEILKLRKIYKQELVLQRQQQQMYLCWKKDNFQGIKDFYVKSDSILPISFGGEKFINDTIAKRKAGYEQYLRQIKNYKNKDKNYFTEVKHFAYKTLAEDTERTLPESRTFYPDSLYEDGFVKLSWYIFFRELLEKSPQFIQKQILLRKEKDKLFTPTIREYLENKYKKQLFYESEQRIFFNNIALLKRFLREDFWKAPKDYLEMLLDKLFLPCLFLGITLVLIALIKTLPH